MTPAHSKASINIRNLTLLFVVLSAMSFSLAGLAFAAPPADAAPAAKAPSEHTVEGVISAVEADGTIIILYAPGKGKVLYVRPTSKLIRNKEPAKVTDLKKGDKAVAKYVGATTIVELLAEGR